MNNNYFLNNEIGTAQADLLEVGLFQNPAFDAAIRFPGVPSMHLNATFSVTQSFKKGKNE